MRELLLHIGQDYKISSKYYVTIPFTWSYVEPYSGLSDLFKSIYDQNSLSGIIGSSGIMKK